MSLDNLTKVHANNTALTPAIVLLAIIGAIRDHEVPAYARMHEAQRLSWHIQAVRVNEVEFDTNELPNYPFIKETVGGLPIKVDNNLCPSTIVLHNAQGKAVSRVQMLAIPIGAGEDFPSYINCYTQAEINKRIKDEGWLFE